MDEKLASVLEQFDIEVRNMYRSRGGFVCITDRGTMILKEFHSSAGKLNDEYELKKNLRERGFSLIDQHIQNKQGTFFAEDRYHTVYTMKEFYEGKECDIRNGYDGKMAAKNLAKFHKIASQVEISQRARSQYQTLPMLLNKRTNEIRRANNYMTKTIKKGDFEHLYIKSYEMFFEQAKEAMSICEQLGEEKEKQCLGICHGEYNQHNVIKTEQGIATINLEHFCYQNQFLDLHQFLRKALEKTQYDKEIAKKILSGYSQEKPLEKEDYEILYLLLLYPDKYLKIANHYNGRRKAFISPKDMEKLQDTIEQNKKKELFLHWYQKEFSVGNFIF